MSVLKANCPNCAGPIEFKAGSTIVVVCPFCRSAVARTDRKLEDLGKVAEIVQSKSPLQLGLRGDYLGNKFELTGRAQIKHGAGGFWDEWYATFSNGWVGWLAEAQGRFYMTFYKPLPEGFQIPSFEEIQPGQRLDGVTDKTHLVVNEKGTATYIAAEGEIPYKLDPNEQSNYADLVGKDGVFATIDYSFDLPYLFFGQELTLAEMGLAEKRAAEREAKIAPAEAMNCPNCGGTLELKAPDKAERVTCPYCNSLLNINEGNLEFLKALKPSPAPQDFLLPIGAKGSFKNFADGVEMEIIGALTRSVTFDGVKYFWNEYLLYNPKVGFKWLVDSDNHWSFVDSINAAELEISQTFAGTKPTVKYNGKSYKIFQDAPAKVEYVKGEFYWRVNQGESVQAADFVAPPFMLSQEKNDKEINWSLGTYLKKEDIERAFGVKNLPKPFNVAPNQPFEGGGLIKYGFLLLGILLLVGIFMIPLTGLSSTKLDQEIVLNPLPNAGASQVVFSQPFELDAKENIRVSAAAPVRNSWTELNIDLVKEGNNEVESVLIPIEYYYGVTDGESWSEGGQTQDAIISAVPAGKYTLRVEGSWQDWSNPMPIRVKVEQNIIRGVNFILAFIFLAIGPIIGLFRKFAFESRRWSESMFGGTG
ncbi:MAG: DUF4178 domain-containing protein [Acidobacteriota bacterium]|nr:DUF4178 domain-containing protein [Acidobacteriota bacterium]